MRLALSPLTAGNADEARRVYNELMKLPRKPNQSFESFTATLDFSEKETTQFAALGAAVAAESEDRMPKAFRYYYKDEADKAETGYLIWTRTGNAWEEKHPSGKDKRFQTAGRDIVEGRPGTVVHWVDKPELTVFISDKHTDQPQAYYHYGGNEWQILGPMEDVQ